MKHDSIFDATSACRVRLMECVESPALMVEEWPRKRLADLNLWATDSGALAQQRASLDQRLADSDKQAIRKVIINLLGLLESLFLRCQKLASKNLAKQSSAKALANTFRECENILAQLARISAAIRRAGTHARLERADSSFDASRHVELKQHLEFLIQIAQGSKEPGLGIHVVPNGNIAEVAQRLVLANLIRRHRFLYARRRWGKQTVERKTAEGQPIDKGKTPIPAKFQALPILERILKSPGFASGAIASGPHVTSAAAGAPSIVTSTVPTAVQGPIQIPQGSRVSTVAPSSTTSKVVYPKPPKTEEGAMFFRCPCCFQTLPVTLKSPARWRKHLSEDIHPYTCILDSCPRPQQLYLTRKEWLRHMREEHEMSKYWLCSACLEPRRFEVESHFTAHLRDGHREVISEEQIPTLISMSTHTAPLSAISCPLCPPPTHEVDIDPNAMLDHAAEHVHSFSLRSLPWPTLEKGEKEYLGFGPDELPDDVTFFDISSKASSANSSTTLSQGDRSDDGTESSSELAFQDENPDVPWEGDSNAQPQEVAAPVDEVAPLDATSAQVPPDPKPEAQDPPTAFTVAAKRWIEVGAPGIKSRFESQGTEWTTSLAAALPAVCSMAILHKASLANSIVGLKVESSRISGENGAIIGNLPSVFLPAASPLPSFYGMRHANHHF
ncbi:hypothetical protein QBC34DRAFT_166332 [Podospora aff. communis PSN243]|uniref:C2H2-type domain-containing protein n=1 Tax=Podospora aff. communis PSN243 TaxID=3040156 RepID=A0AAV9GCU7_9PEZI|nr:hypothetical protein QBC34DRAFT_166332 [Podospora aff. communis PSN243]